MIGRALHGTDDCVFCRSSVVHVVSLVQLRNASCQLIEQSDASISPASQERQGGKELPNTGI